MRISGWSSDVCSSDLLGELEAPALPFAALAEHLRHRRDGGAETVAADVEIALHRRPAIHRRALRGAEATDRDVVARKSSTIDDHLKRKLHTHMHPLIPRLVAQVSRRLLVLQGQLLAIVFEVEIGRAPVCTPVPN